MPSGCLVDTREGRIELTQLRPSRSVAGGDQGWSKHSVAAVTVEVWRVT